MDTVNAWIGMLVSVIAVLGGVAGMLHWLLRTLDKHIARQLGPTNDRIDTQGRDLGARVEAQGQELGARIDAQGQELGARIDAQGQELGARIDRLDRRMDNFEVKLDHVSEVLDLRLRPLEQDMALIKEHMLGSSAA